MGTRWLSIALVAMACLLATAALGGPLQPEGPPESVSAARPKAEPPAEAELPEEAARPAKRVSPGKVQEKLQPAIDEELLKKLERDADGPREDPLAKAIEGMRDAHKRIAGRQTGQPTRDVQQQVIKELEKLIELAQQQPPPSPNQNPNPKPDRSQSRKPRNQPAGSSDSQADQAGSGSGETQKTEADRARESTEEQRRAREREAELARRQDMIKDKWGHLPPSLRQKLLNLTGEKAVPKYDELVRRYFESLAEEGTKR